VNSRLLHNRNREKSAHHCSPAVFPRTRKHLHGRNNIRVRLKLAQEANPLEEEAEQSSKRPISLPWAVLYNSWKHADIHHPLDAEIEKSFIYFWLSRGFLKTPACAGMTAIFSRSASSF